MFKQKAQGFLTIETGEAYQPVRLTYIIADQEKLIKHLADLNCIKEELNPNLWTWYWQDECKHINFSMSDDFQSNSNQPIRLATLNISNNTLQIYLPSFKRACLAVPFFHQYLTPDICLIQFADFLNKIYNNQSETLITKFNDLFKDEELNKFTSQRVSIYEQIEKQCNSDLSMNDALDLLADVVKNQAKWNLPQIERFVFDFSLDENPQIIFLSFYLFMRSRELVLIKRALGKTKYQLADAANDAIQEAFGYNPRDKSHSAIIFRAQALFRGYLTHGKVNMYC